MLLVVLSSLAHAVRAQEENHNAGVFYWNRVQLFRLLQGEFERARGLPVATTARDLRVLVQEGDAIVARIGQSATKIPIPAMARLEEVQFRVAALAASHAELLPQAQDFVNRARLAVIDAARLWPTQQREVHEAIYRVLYGGRTAIEEALIQNSRDALAELTFLGSVPSSTPSAMVAGVRIHSGDIILSRGGVPMSALIARGNTFPGNFSHVALVHVDAETGIPTVIESLIEQGGRLTTVGEFLSEKRLRLLLLRLHPEDRALQDDPLAPHKAASYIRSRVKDHHVPYDFSMDWNDASRFFCSEVVYHAYRAVGIDLWTYKSQLSTPGLMRWLRDMGVRHFTTLIPSDLEYEPRLVPVAEWRNAAMLTQDRLDNVTLDVLLESAERGDRLGYVGAAPLVAGMVKAWSSLQSVLGLTPRIPQGISLTSALRVHALTEEVHPRLRQAIESVARDFKASQGYEAPYWTLIELARDTLAKQRPALSPYLSGPERGGPAPDS